MSAAVLFSLIFVSVVLYAMSSDPERGDVKVNVPSGWVTVPWYGEKGSVDTYASSNRLEAPLERSEFLTICMPGMAVGVKERLVGIVPEIVATTCMPSRFVPVNAAVRVIVVGSPAMMDELVGVRTSCSVPAGVAALCLTSWGFLM